VKRTSTDDSSPPEAAMMGMTVFRSISYDFAGWVARHGSTGAPTDYSKIKAPTSVGRMWLVGLTFLQVAALERLALPGKSAKFSTVRAPSLNAMRLGGGHDRA
jgi:hypothetical protein